jgi:murein DD-endopeptidase MepM/ murein hydrolase activator NlpD
MSDFGARAKAQFDRFFPERQIYHRSGGTVKYIALSPAKQAVLATTTAAVGAWCLYATFSVVMTGHVASSREAENDRDFARLQRELQEAKAREIAARSEMDARAKQFETDADLLEERHETLRKLLLVAGGGKAEDAMVPDNGRVFMQASLEEAEPRQSRTGYIDETAQPVAYRGKINTLRAEQDNILAETEETAVARTEEIRSIIRMTGVGSAVVAEGGMGGPLVEIDATEIVRSLGARDPAFARRVAQVAARLQEYRALSQVRQALPLAPPVGVPFRETSGFGVRFDPFTGRVTHHRGLDMAAHDGAPIIATSPGRVVFAGVKGGYGNTVDIDHGHGFMTRYAHLRSFNVRVGDRVAIGQRIAAMGNTGRSTGVHLHYEVHFRGRQINPVGFLRTGRYVQQQS